MNSETAFEKMAIRVKQLTAEVERLRRILRQVGLHKEAEGD